jgi:hypothetical protein
MSEPALKLVPNEDGEIVQDACAECARLRGMVFNGEQDMRNLEKDLRSWRDKYDRLLKDRDEERMADPQRPQILEVFDHWREKCRHPNARFDGKRFDLIKTRLRDFTVDELKMAIDGASVDAYVDPKGKRHDRLGLILESAERVEDFANRWHRHQKRQEAVA